jgi:hypothetical protein
MSDLSAGSSIDQFRDDEVRAAEFQLITVISIYAAGLLFAVILSNGTTPNWRWSWFRMVRRVHFRRERLLPM